MIDSDVDNLGILEQYCRPDVRHFISYITFYVYILYICYRCFWFHVIIVIYIL